MTYRNLEPISRQLTIVVGLTVVGFMAFGLSLSFYRNILFEQTLEGLAVQNRALRSQISLSQNDIEYFRSAQFKDKYAKESLGRVNPGEKAIIITKNERPLIPTDSDLLTERERMEQVYLQYLQQLPVLEHWRLYLLHRERIEELKRGL
ncbi:MAG: hypothetical protein Greene041619_808 [Candidatus Peregrinibacteria bacterium Greene0416_19]|nr:MAG: hypothetical protein Greene041619_808 [Candidatus Peregrinibacteria bacterium Greene0416_19]